MTPEEIRIKINCLIQERGLNLSQVSLRIGKNIAYLHQFINKGSPIRLPEEQRKRLAKILDVPEQELTDLKLSSSVSQDIDENLLTRIIIKINNWEKENQMEYSPEEKAKIIKFAYQKCNASSPEKADKEIDNIIDIYNYMKTVN